MEFDRPAEIEGELLADEIRAAGLPVDGLWLHGDTLHVNGPTEDDRATVQQVIDDHVPSAHVDPDAELASAITTVRDGASSQDVVDLCDALLGNTSAGRAAGRPTS